MHHMSKTKVIKDRRSIRSYKPDPVSEDVIRDILDCGRLAPTARNVQPWLLGAVTDAGLRGTLADMTEYGKFIADSPVCFADRVISELNRLFGQPQKAASSEPIEPVHIDTDGWFRCEFLDQQEETESCEK